MKVGGKQRDEAENGDITPLDPMAVERGQRLDAWLKKRGMRRSHLARLSGLSEMSLSKYARGIVDIASMTQEAITKLLTAMHISDSFAWELFSIPEERQASWRSLRPPPMGAALDQGTTRDYVLDAPVQGVWQMPVRAIVTVDSSDRASGIQLARQGERYWLATVDELPRTATPLGRFKSAAPPEEF